MQRARIACFTDKSPVSFMWQHHIDIVQKQKYANSDESYRNVQRFPQWLLENLPKNEHYISY